MLKKLKVDLNDPFLLPLDDEALLLKTSREIRIPITIGHVDDDLGVDDATTLSLTKESPARKTSGEILSRLRRGMLLKA